MPANELPLQDEPEDKRALFAPNDDSGLVQGNPQPEVESSAEGVSQDVNIMENQEKTATNKAALAPQFEETTLSIAFDNVFGGTESNGDAGDSKRTGGMSSESMGLCGMSARQVMVYNQWQLMQFIAFHRLLIAFTSQWTISRL